MNNPTEDAISQAFQEAKSMGPLTTVLTHAGAEVQSFWIRGYIHEMQNALFAHMTVYSGPTESHVGTVAVQGGNPGRWDLESSWYALQSITQELADKTVEMFAPIPVLHMPMAARLCVQIMVDFRHISNQMPLGKEGATTNHDAAKFATLLTEHIKAVVLILQSPEPQKVFKQWQSRKFL